jgi:hypothetical protein
VAARAGPAAGLRVCVVGDILLDVVVRLDGLIQPDTDTYGHAVVGAGGQAANVAAWIVALGGSAALVGRHLIRQERTSLAGCSRVTKATQTSAVRRSADQGRIRHRTPAT